MIKNILIFAAISIVCYGLFLYIQWLWEGLKKSLDGLK